MTNPVTAVDLARYDTAERGRRAADTPSRRWRVRTGAVLEAWGRRLRATELRSPHPVAAARVTTAAVR